MKPTQLDEEAIFHAARKIEGHEARGAYLDRAYGPDRGLRDRMDALLRVYDQERSFLEAPAVDSPAAETAAWDPHLPDGPGSVIGPYKLLEPIGEGGMGAVYMAEQVEPVRRRVALKLIKPGMDSKQVVARFEAERQALALMDHPNIAKVHDAGMSASGRPYFVMELVRGLPLTEYCDREELTIPERLELFVLVCRAVQHAHHKGIIHRDLKPSNVLVTLIDGVPTPKVIDFGVAKATGQSLTEKTLFTGFHQFVGTPLYVSPEQADLSSTDVDTRSDIYSLGVLLYELLTGTTPFDSEALKRAAFDEMRRIIREEEPPRPSTRLSSLGERLSSVSARRRADPKRLGSSVKGELDWVVMKALEKDRRRRYETAIDFAADVMRYLADQPVEAHPPSTWYRLRKFARRNRPGLTTAALVAAALVAGTTVSLWQATKARSAAAEARSRVDESKQVIDYLTRDVFGAAVTGRGRSRSATVGELLDRADATVAARFQGQPLVGASVRMALARSYFFLGDYDRSGRHAVRAAELRERHLGLGHPMALEARAQQVWVLCYDGWTRGSDGPAKDAEPIGRRVLAARRRALGPAHPDTLWSQGVLAMTMSHLGRHEEAEALAAQADQLAVRALGPEHEAALWARQFLGLIVERRGDLPRAEALLRQVLISRERTHGSLDWGTLNVLKDLAALVRKQGRSDEARRLYVDTIDRYGRVFGLSHMQLNPHIHPLLELLVSERNYAAIHELWDRWLRELLATPVEADPYQRHWRSVRLMTLIMPLVALPEPHPFDAELVLRAAEENIGLCGCSTEWAALGAAHYRAGNLDEAIRALQAAAQKPNWHEAEPLYWTVLGLVHARRGEWPAARECYEKALARETTWTSTLQLRAEAAALLDPTGLPYDVFAPP